MRKDSGKFQKGVYFNTRQTEKMSRLLRETYKTAKRSLAHTIYHDLDKIAQMTISRDASVRELSEELRLESKKIQEYRHVQY